jgi:hypothetical protein
MLTIRRHAEKQASMMLKYGSYYGSNFKITAAISFVPAVASVPV